MIQLILSERKLNIKKIKAIYLDVGDRDQFHMHYGARKIRICSKSLKLKPIIVNLTEGILIFRKDDLKCGSGYAKMDFNKGSSN